jgi:tRNA threonylcarbamoyl adenosine modification protein (Sua5/YciO/YrdC/YwlC family)
MAGEYIRLYPDNPSTSKIDHIVEVLRKGGVIIYPTDTIYGLGCDIFNNKAIEKVCRIKGINPNKTNLSFICYDLSEISVYASNVTTPVFKVLKKALPGPFTFILKSSSRAPKTIRTSKKTVGIRVPDNNIPRDIVKTLGNPIVTTSLHHKDEVLEYLTDPEQIFEEFRNLVDIVIDGGPGRNVPSTIVSCTDETFTVIRQGVGDFSPFL